MPNNYVTSKPEHVKATAHRGRLNPAQAAAGINAAVRNARRLLADSKRLYSVGSFATAAALAVLAVEEQGKRGIIERILLAKTDKQLSQCWRAYTKHTAKNGGWVIPNLISGGGQLLDDFRILSDANSPHPFFWDDFKHWGFYTECRGAFWSEPQIDITQEVATEVLRIADASIRNARDVTEAQMLLYVKLMSPVWRERPEDVDPNAIREAFKTYLQECQRRGFVPDLEIDLDVFFSSQGRV